MIPLPTGVRVWIAAGHTDMRRGMQSLALQVQQVLKRDPHAGDLYMFRGRSGSLIKILWHDGIGMSLYAKRLERGRFIWPSATVGVWVTTAPLKSSGSPHRPAGIRPRISALRLASARKAAVLSVTI